MLKNESGQLEPTHTVARAVYQDLQSNFRLSLCGIEDFMYVRKSLLQKCDYLTGQFSNINTQGSKSRSVINLNFLDVWLFVLFN